MLVVLGCAVRIERGELVGAVGRRVKRAAEVDRGGVIVVSGGRKWRGIVEADAMRDALVKAGVGEERIVRERCSYSTRENALYVRRILGRRGVDEVAIVTCDWHMPRAAALFRAEGLRVREVPVADDGAGRLMRGLRWCRERLAARKDGVA